VMVTGWTTAVASRQGYDMFLLHAVQIDSRFRSNSYKVGIMGGGRGRYTGRSVQLATWFPLLSKLRMRAVIC
jgi:hypothetical protein